MLLPRIMIIPSFLNWQILLPSLCYEPHLNRYCLLSSKWNGHMLQQLAGVIARWQIILP